MQWVIVLHEQNKYELVYVVMVSPRAYKRREGMQQRNVKIQRVGGWMCMHVHEVLQIDFDFVYILPEGLNFDRYVTR